MMRFMAGAAPPLLLVDIDGVISLFGFAPGAVPAGRFVTVDGILHLLGAGAGARLARLATAFELAWCSGWEEKANEHLPHALGLAGPLPHLAFDGRPASGAAHWKLASIEAYAPRERALAWVDDSLDASCHAWAAARAAPTLLVPTRPQEGLTDPQVTALMAWAAALGGPTP